MNAPLRHSQFDFGDVAKGGAQRTDPVDSQPKATGAALNLRRKTAGQHLDEFVHSVKTDLDTQIVVIAGAAAGIICDVLAIYWSGPWAR